MRASLRSDFRRSRARASAVASAALSVRGSWPNP